MIGVLFLLGIYAVGAIGLMYSLVAPNTLRFTITPMHARDTPVLPPLPPVVETYL